MNERTRAVTLIVIAGILLLTWQPLMRGVEKMTGLHLLFTPPPPEQMEASTQPASQPASQPAGVSPATTTATAGQATVALPSTQPGQLSIAPPTTVPANIALGSAVAHDPKYALQLNVSPVGASLDGVVLNDYTQKVESPDRFTFDLPYGDGVAPLATRSITIDGHTQDLSGSVWNVVKKDDNSVTLGLDINDGKNPLLSIYKQFTVLPRNEKGAEGYDTQLVTQFVNRTDRPMKVATNLIGPTFPPSEQARGGDRQVIAGYRGTNVVELGHDTLESFSSSTVSKTYTQLNGQPMLWFGAGGNYFNAIVRPTGGMWFKETTATLVNPENTDPAAHEVVLGIQSNDVQLAPNGAAVLKADVFFGPRFRTLLNNAYYAARGVQYGQTLALGGSSCTWCTFQWLVEWLMDLLGLFHWVLRDWGLAIIALVFIVRAVLHPITKRSQISMAKMGKMGPEMEKLKAKYKDDKDALNRAMMQFYKEQGAGPILGCLPMFLQMPIWVALYSGLSSTFELRQAPFLRWSHLHLTWITDLSKPDHLVQFAQPLNLGFLHLDGINLLPVLMAIAYFFQQKLTPKPPASTPEQQQQQKMMQWMTLLFPVMLYSSPAGLNLYIFTSATFGIIENQIIRKHIREREALQSQGPTFVEGEIVAPTNPYAKQPAKKKGGIMGFLAGLQEKAEQLKVEAEKQQKKKKKR